MNSYFTVLDKTKYICKILKTLNLDFIKNEDYLTPFSAERGINVFFSTTSVKKINTSLSKKGNF